MFIFDRHFMKKQRRVNNPALLLVQYDSVLFFLGVFNLIKRNFFDKNSHKDRAKGEKAGHDEAGKEC